MDKASPRQGYSDLTYRRISARQRYANFRDYASSRLRDYGLTLDLDLLLGLTLCLAGLYAYTATLAPTVLEGDAALYQYTPYVLGVTYPTGYPLYILLGKVWLTLLPWGEVAWRMNLFSAVCAALALPLIYGATRRLLLLSSENNFVGLLAAWSVTRRRSRTGSERSSIFVLGGVPPAHENSLENNRLECKACFAARQAWGIRLAALTTVLVFATLPTFWRWSTEAKIYTLNILLFSGVLYTLALALTKEKQASQNVGSSLALDPQGDTQSVPNRYRQDASLHDNRQDTPLQGDHQSAPLPLPRPTSHVPRPTSHLPPLALPALLLGLQASVHSTTILLIPGLLLLVWLQARRLLLDKKSWLITLLLFIGPGLLYFYVPIRAEWLIAQYGRPEAIARGLMADFYHSGFEGFVRYFSAADFTGGVVTNWGLVPEQIFTFYLPTLLADEVAWLGIALGLVGGLGLAVARPRLFWPLFLIYATPIPFVLTYGQGEQSAFLLPSFLIFAIGLGYILALLGQLLATRLSPQAVHIAQLLLFLILIPTLFFPQIHYNLNWLDAKWDRSIYDEWADALAHPLEPGAAVLAHWGDLTSFWYMQYAEGRRPDLRGLYPPTEEMVTDYLRSGGDLYIAGPLQGWAAGVEDRYRLLPWGRLVRIAPRQVDPQTLLPPLPHQSQAIFDHRLRLIGVDYPPQALSGGDYPVRLGWQALAELPPETAVSLRLSQGETIVAQLDDTLLSGWFPRPTLPAEQHVLSYMPIPIPMGVLPGRYRLQLVVYLSYKHPWSMADGTTLLDLGEVEIVSPQADDRPELIGSEAGLAAYTPMSGYDFNGELELAGYEYTVARVGQGKGFAVKFLWRARTKPVDNYLVRAEVVDPAGRVLQAVEYQPAAGRAPTAAWQPGQFVRDQVDFVLPASAPAGEQAVRVRVGWVRPDGSQLKVRRWRLPLGDHLKLAWLDVVEKEGRVFEIPPLQYPIGANLEDKARLLGYDASLSPLAESPAAFQFSRTHCPAEAEVCDAMHFDFYWQGLREMDLLYFVFLHVVDAQGQIVAQHDLGPGQRGKQPTTSWLPGEIVTDPVDLALPAKIAPGQYTMRLGLYLPPDGPRLLILDENGQAIRDFIEIGTIQVTP